MHIDASQGAEIRENEAIACAQVPVSLRFAHTLFRVEVADIEGASSIEYFFPY